MSERQMGESKQ